MASSLSKLSAARSLLKNWPVGLMAVGLALGLFGETIAVRSVGYLTTWDSFIAPLFRELTPTLSDPRTQWLVASCLTIYILAFLLLPGFRVESRFWRWQNADMWMVGLLVAGVIAYAHDYLTAASSTSALTWLAGLGFWQGIRTFFKSGRRPILYDSIPVIFVFWLALASVWHPPLMQVYEYRGRTRWAGPWDSPNLFGLLMGTGIILAMGLTVATCFRWSREGVSAPRHPFRAKQYTVLAAGLTLTALMATGLLCSFSRGGWLATVGGLTYLLFQLVKHQPSARTVWIRTHLVSLTLILFSTLVLAFWHFRQTEWHPARRAFSVANANDFSWRNRVTAWEGALAMLDSRPWSGFGWEEVEPTYDHFFRPQKVQESMAIHMNDYLMLGTTLGLPALFCFFACIFCSFRSASVGSISDGERDTFLDRRWLRAAVKAGLIVLLIGFWFDGAFFKLPTTTLFWILLAWLSVSSGKP